MNSAEFVTLDRDLKAHKLMPGDYYSWFVEYCDDAASSFKNQFIVHLSAPEKVVAEFDVALDQK